MKLVRHFVFIYVQLASVVPNVGPSMAAILYNCLLERMRRATAEHTHFGPRLFCY